MRRVKLIVMIAFAINDRLQRKLDYVEEERASSGSNSTPPWAAKSAQPPGRRVAARFAG